MTKESAGMTQENAGMTIEGEYKLKKITIILLAVLFLSGCAAYQFQKSASSGSQGYLVSYDGQPILEYTVGKEKSLPDLSLAGERFKRRRPAVERYYKQMGQIQPRLKELFWEPPAMLADFLGGILRWPFIAVSDYRYNHNPKYKERADRIDEEKDALEKARINSLKEKLAAYIVEDLAKESSPPGVVTTAHPASESPQSQVLPSAQQPLDLPHLAGVETAAPAAQIKTRLEPPVAVIAAKPIKGHSPLTVKFSGQRSYSKNGKIAAYSWDFGDGDTSAKKNPENTYWSAAYGARNFTVTLTVKDTAGLTSTSTLIIEVSTP